jgi:hypothetical protein
MSKAPETLYHYTTQSGLLGILSSKALWATKIHYLNDASEFRLASTLATSILQKLINGEGNLRQRRKIQALQINLREIENLNVCVSSLSIHSDSLSQWRAYGGTAGYAVGLDRKQLLGFARSQGFELLQCVYDHRRQHELVEELIVDSLAEDFNVTPMRIDKSRPRRVEVLAVGGDFAERFAKLAPRLKSGAFREEGEWRLVSKRGVGSDEFDFRPGISMITPYLSFSIANDTRSSITSITIGPTPHPELSSDSVRMLAGNLGLGKPVSIKASATPYRSW